MLKASSNLSEFRESLLSGTAILEDFPRALTMMRELTEKGLVDESHVNETALLMVRRAEGVLSKEPGQVKAILELMQLPDIHADLMGALWKPCLKAVAKEAQFLEMACSIMQQQLSDPASLNTALVQLAAVLAKIMSKHERRSDELHHAILDAVDGLADGSSMSSVLSTLVSQVTVPALLVRYHRRLGRGCGSIPLDWLQLLTLNNAADQAFWMSSSSSIQLGMMLFSSCSDVEKALCMLERASLQAENDLARLVATLHLRRSVELSVDLFMRTTSITRRLLLGSLLPWASLLPGHRVAFERALRLGKDAMQIAKSISASPAAWPPCLLDTVYRCLANLVRESVIEQVMLSDLVKLITEPTSVAKDQLRVALLRRGQEVSSSVPWHSRFLSAIMMESFDVNSQGIVRHGLLVGMESVARFASDLSPLQRPPLVALQPQLLAHMQPDRRGWKFEGSLACLHDAIQWPAALSPRSWSLPTSASSLQAELKSDLDRLVQGIKKYRRCYSDNDPFLIGLIEQLTMNIRE